VTDRDTGTPKPCTAKELALDWYKGSPAADTYVSRFGGGTGNAVATQMPCTVGEVRLTAGSRAAAGVPAIGQLLPINMNVALFALLGTTYGGDGKVDVRAAGPAAGHAERHDVCIQGDWPT